ncbi:hypothetical protein GCM10011390_51250 [Aureimonas endophytica]|uniref:Uncharacterized protein n=1 Tax=Aureimonas endophytica TaxID=2027858 RepID=A0A917A550_9HYPH|nr:hypothetical protein [Aureimonas endophytica]GGE25535.1 hypothetical protein GCM10011390_51250 [Aureimonas endophytica]
MQFRRRGERVQCLAPYYDREAKRVRQRMVHSMPFWAASPDHAPALSDLPQDATDEERQQWRGQIVAHLLTRQGIESVQKQERAHTSFERAATNLVDAWPSMSADQRKAVRGALRRIERVVVPSTRKKADPQPEPRPRAGGTPARAPSSRTFDGALVARARALRGEGMAMAAIAERMTGEGTPVSKSWVQKVAGGSSPA